MQLTSNFTKRQRGLSLVELMVGLTVGLIVAAGASMVAVNQINEHRRLMLEVQVQQDLRAAADLIQQDIRRAGFRGIPQFSVWQPPRHVGTAAEKPAQAASANPYAGISRTSSGNELTFAYSYARDTTNTDDVPPSTDSYGIRWDSALQVLYLRLGSKNNSPNWQPITDPASVKIINFDIVVTNGTAEVSDFCDSSCSGSGCPQQLIRTVEYTIQGKASHDSAVVRTLSGVERIRADSVTGVCS